MVGPVPRRAGIRSRSASPSRRSRRSPRGGPTMVAERRDRELGVVAGQGIGPRSGPWAHGPGRRSRCRRHGSAEVRAPVSTLALRVGRPRSWQAEPFLPAEADQAGLHVVGLSLSSTGCAPGPASMVSAVWVRGSLMRPASGASRAGGSKEGHLRRRRRRGAGPLRFARAGRGANPHGP